MATPNDSLYPYCTGERRKRMTVSDVLRVVDATRENKFDDMTKIGWLNEVEGMIFCETGRNDGAEFVPLFSSADEVSLSEPYSRMYFLYIYAMMAMAKSEFSAYLKIMTEFEKIFAQYAKSVIRSR